jgi:bis(5'-nucleosyl)-tetraphosphatase (symmetrical)
MATVVIGDVHGCLEELDELLAHFPRDRVVLVGDLMDRGPDPVGVVRRVRERKLACVLGNHDEKHVRWARHEAKARAQPSYTNPMRPLPDDRLAANRALGDDGLAFLADLPHKIELGDNWWAVHGGCVPNVPLRRQKPAVLLRCRWVDDAGSMLGLPDRPPHGRHWAEVWPGPQKIVYGHHVHGLADPHRDEHAIGIDTGCCFGGRLTAYVIDSDEIVQVPARRKYADLRDPDA